MYIQITNLTDETYELAKDGINHALRQIGNEVAKEARLLLNTQTVSLANGIPMSQTGLLARSLKATKRKGNSIQISANTRYATALMAGSRRVDGTIVAPRPLLEITLERMQGKIQQIIENAIHVEITKQ